MFAIVEIAGKQYKVFQDKFLYVNRLKQSEGEEFFLNCIYLFKQQNEVIFGYPIIEGITIQVKVLKHIKGDKIIVFKKKRRKGYRVKIGHRQKLTKIKILSLSKNINDEKLKIG